ncbi:MAG: hypothetical protein SGILL_005115 [Bacillariaceae sp.]
MEANSSSTSSISNPAPPEESNADPPVAVPPAAPAEVMADVKIAPVTTIKSAEETEPKEEIRNGTAPTGEPPAAAFAPPIDKEADAKIAASEAPAPPAVTDKPAETTTEEPMKDEAAPEAPAELEPPAPTEESEPVAKQEATPSARDALLAAEVASMDAVGQRFPKRERKQRVDTHAVEKEKQKKKQEKLAEQEAIKAAEEAAAACPPPDAHEGRYVEGSKLLGHTTGQFYPLNGKLVEYREAEGRIPGRYAIQWEHPIPDGSINADFVQEDEWVQEDLTAFEESVMKGTTPITTYSAFKASNPSHHPPALKMALENVRQRCAQVVHSDLESSNVLSTLIVMAALEEALQSSLQQQQDVDAAAAASGMANTSSKRKSAAKPHPPLYYMANPTSYLQPPTAEDGGSLSSATTKTQMMPVTLAQRVRQGCQWAWAQLQSQQPIPPLLAAPVAKRLTEGTIVPGVDNPADIAAIVAASNGGSSVAQRRSVRAVRVTSYAEEAGLDLSSSRTRKAVPGIGEPNPVQKGGRVAMWWLQELEQSENKPNEAAEEDVEMEDPSPVKPKAKNGKATKKKAQAKSKAEEVDAAPSFDDSEPEEDTKEDDDDYSGGGDDEDDDDESLEGVERERTQLSPVRDPDDDDEMEEDEEEVDEEQEVVWNNPYLQSSFPAFLEYLARPKSITMEEIQKAMDEITLKVRFSKRNADHGIFVTDLGTADKVALNLEKPNHPSNGMVVLKCVSGETAGDLQRLDANAFGRCKFELDVIGDEEKAIQTQRKEDLIQQEIVFKERKAWDRWRFKGIHEGYAVWPSWEESALEWVKENVTATEIPPVAAAMPTESDETKTDEALAKTLEEMETGGGSRRRTARRAAASSTEGVFYGNQSGLSQKQLMDASLRLIKTSPFQTLMKLNALVADDSSDPIRRARIALGKMVWKQNLIVRKQVIPGAGDEALESDVASGNLLLALKSAPDGEGTMQEADEPEGVVDDLIMYLSRMHQTELRLRELVLKQLADVPVPVIATAADERIGSLENLDGGDFEDESKIDWKTSGNPLLGKLIYRPPTQYKLGTEATVCNWYKVVYFSESIKSEEEDAEENAMERRKRFRAVPAEGPGGEYIHDGEVLFLTEAQVHAGEKAGQMQLAQQKDFSKPNPYARVSGDTISLAPVDDDEGAQITGRIVAHDSIADGSEVEYRVLILPKPNPSTGEQKPAFWAVLDERADDATYVCQPLGQTTWYAIESQQFLQDSDAYNECEKILNWLTNQSKAAAFMVPVDPVALGIPTYPQVVKHPMDISTIADKLEKGHYSSVPPGQSYGHSPSCQMLNGPFRKDIELMFNNAILFNPPDDWIHQAAQSLKKSAVKKIETASSAAERSFRSSGGRNRSLYVYNDDSDQDMYEYESDQDEEYGGRRKRKRGPRASTNKDEAAARPLEHTIRLHHCLKDGNDLRGPFGNFSINTDANTFTMPSGWNCRKRDVAASSGNDSSEEKAVSEDKSNEELTEEDKTKQELAREMADLLELRHALGEQETSGIRRSTRTHHEPARGGASKKPNAKVNDLEYFSAGSEVEVSTSAKLPSSRLDVEVAREESHEEHYSKLFIQYEKKLVAIGKYGAYVNGAFPPYLGRVAPSKNSHGMMWEIRSNFAVPALRWIIRGLINSGHLTAVEPMTSDVTSGVVIKNDIYFWDPKEQPFEVLDVRGLQRRKRAGNVAAEESEDEYEMNEYERLRAERVQRNADRLKMLGLA